MAAEQYLVTDDDVARTAAQFAATRPGLDDVSLGAMVPSAAPQPLTWDIPGDAQNDAGEPADTPDGYQTTTAEDSLWLALCMASDEGADIAELLRASGMSRPTLYRHLAEHARAGRAIQVSRGRWRAATTEGPR